MSKELELIAEALAQHRVSDGYEECACGYGPESFVHSERRSLHDAHVSAVAMSKLSEHGYSIVPTEDAEILKRVRWRVDGSQPMDLGTEYADGFNAAMRSIERVLHLTATCDCGTCEAIAASRRRRYREALECCVTCAGGVVSDIPAAAEEDQ